MIKSWANVITFFRILLIPAFLFFLLSNLEYSDFISASIFAIAALSDAFDGYLARLRKEESKLGKYFDPLADQLLVTCGLIGLVGLNIISVWIAFAFISRELIISGLRSYASSSGIIIESSMVGKTKTWLQSWAVIFYIFVPRFSEFAWGGYYRIFAFNFILIALTFSFVSAAEYFKRSKKVFIK